MGVFLTNNLKVYNDYVDDYTSYELVPQERNILVKFKERWGKTRMLDIGVGTGRTSFTFSAIVNDYTGIDYSHEMIKKCKTVIEENESVRFDLQDATDLSQYIDNKFDFILFSMNGLCSVGHDDRVKILSEVYKVISDDGFFFFSTHSLHTFPNHFPFKIKLPKFNKRQPLHWAYQWWKLLLRRFRIQRLYKGVDTNEICGKPWAILATGDHDFKIQIYHIKPDYQVKQLEDSGFEVVSVYDERGNERDPLKENINEYMYFLCKKNKV
ncbi:hypothetical protein MNBD_GAMMA23-375 [hydrothermal vent metagenome]|uniref:Methyltransferase domain-containing protein n=1 Tax=hydrothermal vent metagenome TaxID=652676 RepID=A0A3B0ZZB8_9ZZZZ